MSFIGNVIRFVVGLALLVLGVRFLTIQFALFKVDFSGINIYASGMRSVPTDDWKVLWGAFVWVIGDALIAFTLAFSLIVGFSVMFSGVASSLSNRVSIRRG